MSGTTRDGMGNDPSRSDEAVDAVTTTRELPRINCGLTVSEPYPNVAIYTVTATLSHAEFDHYLADMDRRLRYGAPHVIVLNLKLDQPTPAWQRQRRAAWLDERRQMLRRVNPGIAVILAGDTDPEAAETFLALSEQPGEQLVCKNLAEALFFAQNHLRKN